MAIRLTGEISEIGYRTGHDRDRHRWPEPFWWDVGVTWEDLNWITIWTRLS